MTTPQELAPATRSVFVTGGTGYLGRPPLAALLAQGVRVRALARPGAEAKLPQGCEVIRGDALDGDSYGAAVRSWDVFVHLVGVAHPSPRKGAQFRTVDLASVAAAIRLARATRVAAIGTLDQFDNIGHVRESRAPKFQFLSGGDRLHGGRVAKPANLRVT